MSKIPGNFKPLVRSPSLSLKKNHHMRVRHALLSLFAILLAGTAAYAQPGQRKSPHDTVKTKEITITYGRPYKKGRDIFGALEPYGKVYRCGADEATQITFAKDVTFGGKAVKSRNIHVLRYPQQRPMDRDPEFEIGSVGCIRLRQVQRSGCRTCGCARQDSERAGRAAHDDGRSWTGDIGLGRGRDRRPRQDVTGSPE